MPRSTNHQTKLNCIGAEENLSQGLRSARPRLALPLNDTICTIKYKLHFRAAENGPPQLLFDERDLFEITALEMFPGERLIVCRNRELAVEGEKLPEDVRRYPTDMNSDGMLGYVYNGYIDPETNRYAEKTFWNHTRQKSMYPAPNDVLCTSSDGWLRSAPHHWDSASQS